MTRARGVPGVALGRVLALAGALALGDALPAAAQAPAAGDLPAERPATGRGQPAERTATRLMLGYSASFPLQPFGAEVMLWRRGPGLFVDIRTTIPDPSFSDEVPTVHADTITTSPGHQKDFDPVHRSYTAGITWGFGRWGVLAGAGWARRRVYLEVVDEAGTGVFNEIGRIWGEDRSKRRDGWTFQGGVIRQLAPGVLVHAGVQTRPLGGAFGFALAVL